MKNKIVFGLLLLAISILIRLMYNQYNGSVYIYADTYSYYQTGEKILKNPLRYFINEQRPLLYPLFLHANMIFTGYYSPKLLSPEFFQGLVTVYKTQSFIALVSLVIFYITLLRFGFPIFSSFLMSSFIGVNILLFAWEKISLTESLSTSMMIIFLFLCLLYIQKPSKLILCTLFIGFLCAFFLKPIYLLLPYAIMPVLLLIHHQKQLLRTGFILLSLYTLLIIYFHIHNAIQFQYFGVSRNTDINMLGKILQFDLPIERAKQYDFLYENIKKYKKSGGELQPYRFLEFYDLSIYQDPKGRFNLLKEFNNKVIMAHLGEFIFKSLKQIPSSVLDTSEVTIVFPSKHPYSSFFNFWYALFLKLQYVTFIVFPGLLCAVIQFFKRKTAQSAFILIVGIICWYQIFLSVFFSYGEFGRLITPAQPLLYLFSFYWLGIAVKKLATNPQKEK